MQNGSMVPSPNSFPIWDIEGGGYQSFDKSSPIGDLREECTGTCTDGNKNGHIVPCWRATCGQIGYKSPPIEGVYETRLKQATQRELS